MSDVENRLKRAIALGVYAKAVQDARIGERDDPPFVPPFEPHPPWPPYDPAAPDNNADPQHHIDEGAVVSFPLLGHPGTRFQEISIFANIIPRSEYPVDTVQIYLGMNRPLVQMEADYLNEQAGFAP